MVKKFGRIGTNFGISFLQTGASLNKARGSERERVTFVCIIQILNTRTLAHLMNGELKPMRMPNCLKKRLKYGMTKGYKSVS